MSRPKHGDGSGLLGVAVGRSPQSRRSKAACVLGRYCTTHEFTHGAEAEELRERFQKLADAKEAAGKLAVAGQIRAILDDVDARDSVAWLECTRRDAGL